MCTSSGSQGGNVRRAVEPIPSVRRYGTPAWRAYQAVKSRDQKAATWLAKDPGMAPPASCTPAVGFIVTKAVSLSPPERAAPVPVGTIEPRQGGAIHQGRQERDQMDAAVMQSWFRRSTPFGCTAFTPWHVRVSRQLHADRSRLCARGGNPALDRLRRCGRSSLKIRVSKLSGHGRYVTYRNWRESCRPNVKLVHHENR